MIGLVCVQRGSGEGGRSPGSARSKVKCCHGSLELGIERAEACRMGFWGLGRPCNGSGRRAGGIDSLNVCFLLKEKKISNCAY